MAISRPTATAMGSVTTASRTVSCKPCQSSGQMRTNESQSAKLSRKSCSASISVGPSMPSGSEAFEPAAGDDQRQEEQQVKRRGKGQRRGIGGDRHGALRAAQQLGQGDGG